MSILQEWVKVATQLKALKVQEDSLRRELAGITLEGMPFEKGRIVKKQTISGYLLKTEQKLSYSLDVDMVEHIWDTLNEDEKACIKTKVVLWDTAYKKLPENSKLHEAVTSKPSMPSITATFLEE